MDPELKSMLTETLALAKDNHRMLRAIRRDQWWGFISKLIFWVAVVFVPAYFYYQYLAPLLPSSAELQNLVNQYKLNQ